MKITLEFDDGNYAVDLTASRDISIPVQFEGDQLSAFGAPPAKKEVYKAEEFVGNVAQGGSCNCETYSFSPHLNGTHTECVGHISGNQINIHDIIEDSFIPATLVTVTPEEGLITRSLLAKALSQHNSDFMAALIVRTMPNDAGKIARNYGESMPSYFSEKAMEYISELHVKHLLVDMPSVDKLDDGGALANHRIFWNVKPGETDIKPSPKTITELIYVPDEIKDASYLLNLQVAAFKADAAPSRPVLFEVKPL